MENLYEKFLSESNLTRVDKMDIIIDIVDKYSYVEGGEIQIKEESGKYIYFAKITTNGLSLEDIENIENEFKEYDWIGYYTFEGGKDHIIKIDIDEYNKEEIDRGFEDHLKKLKNKKL